MSRKRRSKKKVKRSDLGLGSILKPEFKQVGLTDNKGILNEDSPVESIEGVGKVKGQKLRAKGISTVKEYVEKVNVKEEKKSLAEHFPKSTLKPKKEEIDYLSPMTPEEEKEHEIAMIKQKYDKPLTPDVERERIPKLVNQDLDYQRLEKLRDQMIKEKEHKEIVDNMLDKAYSNKRTTKNELLEVIHLFHPKYQLDSRKTYQKSSAINRLEKEADRLDELEKQTQFLSEIIEERDMSEKYKPTTNHFYNQLRRKEDNYRNIRATRLELNQVKLKYHRNLAKAKDPKEVDQLYKDFIADFRRLDSELDRLRDKTHKKDLEVNKRIKLLNLKKLESSHMKIITELDTEMRKEREKLPEYLAKSRYNPAFEENVEKVANEKKKKLQREEDFYFFKTQMYQLQEDREKKDSNRAFAIGSQTFIRTKDDRFFKKTGSSLSRIKKDTYYNNLDKAIELGKDIKTFDKVSNVKNKFNIDTSEFLFKEGSYGFQKADTTEWFDYTNGYSTFAYATEDTVLNQDFYTNKDNWQEIVNIRTEEDFGNKDYLAFSSPERVEYFSKEVLKEPLLMTEAKGSQSLKLAKSYQPKIQLHKDYPIIKLELDKGALVVTGVTKDYIEKEYGVFIR